MADQSLPRRTLSTLDEIDADEPTDAAPFPPATLSAIVWPDFEQTADAVLAAAYARTSRLSSNSPLDLQTLVSSANGLLNGLDASGATDALDSLLWRTSRELIDTRDPEVYRLAQWYQYQTLRGLHVTTLGRMLQTAVIHYCDALAESLPDATLRAA